MKFWNFFRVDPSNKKLKLKLLRDLQSSPMGFFLLERTSYYYEDFHCNKLLFQLQTIPISIPNQKESNFVQLIHSMIGTFFF
ncbi:hypothetical protein [Shimazuella kribbensis]|uniref:hypothetical protein n=1 Tax=Shimazuella kribbensis TaxID=139808 RepID=UPI00048E3654|nr:hypothetical protein [Shimazuella kribbensis]